MRVIDVVNPETKKALLELQDKLVAELKQSPPINAK